MVDDSDKVSGLRTTIRGVRVATALIEGALLDNPSLAEERALNETLQGLHAHLTALQVQLQADRTRPTADLPSSQQMAEMKSLIDQMETATKRAIPIRDKIDLATKISASTNKLLAIIGPWPPR